MRVYIASSWRNTHYPKVCAAVRAAGHEVLDWRDGESLLPHWGIADERFAQATRDQKWTPELARDALQHMRVRSTHAKDMRLLNAADAVVLLTPCGRSAHLEAGIAEGRGLPRAVLLTDGVEPELMTCGLTPLTTEASLIEWLSSVGRSLDYASLVEQVKQLKQQLAAVYGGLTHASESGVEAIAQATAAERAGCEWVVRELCDRVQVEIDTKHPTGAALEHLVAARTVLAKAQDAIRARGKGVRSDTLTSQAAIARDAERERDELCDYLLGQNIDPSMHEGVRALVLAYRERKAGAK